MPDPKLKACMEEIKASLKKYDATAVCVISSPTHQEFLLKPDASWTCMFWEGPLLRFRSLGIHYPNRAEQKRVAEHSTGCIFGFISVLGKLLEDLNAMASMLAGHYKSIEHYDREEQE